MRKYWLAAATEVCLIVLFSAAVGLVWNRSLLTSAWRGEATGLAQAAPAGQVPPPKGGPQAARDEAQAPRAEEVPMPVGLAQVKELYDAKQATIIDARSSASFSEGHIAGALSLPLEEARKNPAHPVKAQLAPDATIVAYCNGFSCHDSMDLAQLLMHAGYRSVYVYEGGFPEWRDSGYPVAKGVL